MSREQERIRKKLENNPIAECNKIQNRFCPELFSVFDRVKDPRNQSYIDSSRVMLGTSRLFLNTRYCVAEVKVL